MGKSESQQGCKQHQNEKQLPGVCSSCLREKLSQLNVSASNMKTSTGGFGYFGSSSPNSSSTSSSIFVSPIYGRHHRRALEKTGSISLTLKVGHDYGLKKSRSIAFVSRSLHEEAAGSGKKKGGFWSKLLWSTGKRTKDVLKHSRAESKRLE
ncbi:uncharacterized protein LOC121249295 [Juglans microcarpa x Juglans regia]|uniref:uncharacterized protein LOC121249295 n=1 Tax=Juglans microcarpa x Juglans regia TaxID=2249226 RepID=UPI001B7EF666|nr:uncharacterized protein LOC121249295 [Juglans microcarpa x Juglans regia]